MQQGFVKTRNLWFNGFNIKLANGNFYLSNEFFNCFSMLSSYRITYK